MNGDSVVFEREAENITIGRPDCERDYIAAAVFPMLAFVKFTVQFCSIYSCAFRSDCPLNRVPVISD